MRENYGKQNATTDFAIELINLNATITQQEKIIDELELKAATYKARFFGKYDLAEKLDNQIKENFNNLVGEFDGFSYASWRAHAVYRTLGDMYKDNLITEEELRLCEVL